MDGEKQQPEAAEKLLFRLLVGHACPSTPVIVDPQKAAERVGKLRSPQAPLSAGVIALGSLALSAISLAFPKRSIEIFPFPNRCPSSPSVLCVVTVPAAKCWGRKGQAHRGGGCNGFNPALLTRCLPHTCPFCPLNYFRTVPLNLEQRRNPLWQGGFLRKGKSYRYSCMSGDISGAQVFKVNGQV